MPSKGTVLLKFDAGAGQWSRVPSGEAVTSNEQLLVLPTYRPTIALSDGLTLQVPAETLLELEPPDVKGIPTVKLIYGRLVVLTAGKGGIQLGLDLGGQSGVISFLDADATLGAEVSRHFAAGANPEVEPPQVVANLYGARRSSGVDAGWRNDHGAGRDANVNAPSGRIGRGFAAGEHAEMD